MTKGAQTVRSDERAKPATAAEDGELVYVTYPHWMEAQSQSEHADMLDAFHPVP